MNSRDNRAWREAIYCNFETFNVKVKESEEDTFIRDHNWDPTGSGCEIKTNHQESGFTFYSVSDYFGTKIVHTVKKMEKM